MPAARRFGLGKALWRTRAWLLPELKHFVLFFALSGIAMLLDLAVFLVGFDLLTNKVFLGEALNETQAGLLGLEHSRFVAVAALGEDARFELRTVFLVLIGVLIATGFLLGTGLGYYRTWILQRVNQHLRLTMMERAVHLSLRYHDRTRVGDGIYRVYQDSAMVTNVVQNALFEPALALGNLLVAFTAISLFAPYLGLLFIVAAVPAVLAARFFTPRLREQSRLARSANSTLTSHIQESVSAARVLKANGAEDEADRRFASHSRTALDRAYELRVSVATLNLCVFLAGAVAVLVADFLMAHWVWDEAPTFGYGLAAVVSFAAWNLGAFQAARDRNIALGGVAVALSNLWSVLQDMGVGLKRAFLLLDIEPEVQDAPDALPLPPVAEGVSFEAVIFGYAPALPVLRDLSARAVPGELTAVVGASGAGKSTLMSLLLRLYDVDDGSIRIDGVDVREIELRALRAGISIVLQENALFPTTVLDNVRYAAPDATREDVVRAAEIACADRFIREMPAGYDTLLGERGAKLSAGQRQRLSIARAVLKDAPILILDEPTAALDVETEREVLERLMAWGAGKVLFLITHRLATIRRADRIVFVEDGAAREVGSHEELMARAGRYADFVASETGAVGVSASRR